MPKVSVILPAHGDAPYLEQAVDSVLCQTLANIELVVIDERASQKTRDLLLKFEERDNRVKVVKSENTGLPGALNTAIRHTSSEFIARLDDDDLMSRTRLETQIGVLIANPGIVCLGSQVEFFGEEMARTTSRLPKYDWQIRRESRVLNPMAHPSLMFRKSALLEAGMYDERYLLAQDYELFSRLLPLGKFHNLDEPLTRYRIHKDQISSHRATERYPFELSALVQNNLTSSPTRATAVVTDFLDSTDPTLLFHEVMHGETISADVILEMRRSARALSSVAKFNAAVRALYLAPRVSSGILVSKFFTLLKTLMLRKKFRDSSAAGS